MAGVKILAANEMSRWDNFVAAHSLGSIYHTSWWKDIIEEVYGHKPVYLAIEAPDGTIMAGLPLFLVHSRLQGKRLSALPCAQSCDPLVSNQGEYDQFVNFILDFTKHQGIEYAEIKTSEHFAPNSRKFGSAVDCYCTYTLDTGRDPEVIKNSFHKNCIQRAIQKAYKNDLELETGKTLDDVKTLYDLYFNMRREYGLLPQPYSFFSAMWEVLREKEHIEILQARHRGRVVSSILLLKYKDTVIYEYGASNSEAASLQASPFLLWEAIKQASLQGYKKFDFGRTSEDNFGLNQFKSRWGTKRESFRYYTIPHVEGMASVRQKSLAKQVMYYSVKYLPKPFCRVMGDALYKDLV